MQTGLAQTLQSGAIGADVAQRTFAHQERTLLLNYYDVNERYVFGELASFRADGLIALIRKYDRPTSVLDIRQDRPAQGHDFLHGLLYFMALGNHVLVIESSSVRSKAFANYLTWFLGPDRGSILEAGDRCELDAQITIQMDEDEAEVTSAIFDPLAQRRMDARREAAQAEEVEEKRRIWQDVVRAPAKVLALLKAAGATDASIETALSELPDDAKLEAQLRVQARTRTRPEKISPRLINSLFNVGDEDALVLETPEGRRVGQIGTLRHGVRVETEGDLMVRTDVERALFEAYTVFVENGRIDPVG
ncbi:MAG: hypothetical protein M3177_00020 [Pseudomonadota bacterium]|nr:hypothetical protein [Pseudomonadota bacterium]